ncbi:hypothetical protein D9613_011981 [Agrocybe pediades]|uniref:Ndc10 domain-containing protein n=1 Tax=Agrocybe pediades TaxID=84607 RepID=A0A8H4VHU5_9AGAR|nr:hypothetical protein D9613_011981 [Agrocybe pediades]
MEKTKHSPSKGRYDFLSQPGSRPATTYGCKKVPVGNSINLQYSPATTKKIFPSSSSQQSGTAPILFTMNVNESGHAPDIPTVPFNLPTIQTSTAGSSALLGCTTVTPMDSLVQETHQQRVLLQDAMISDKGTQIAYSRHLENYEKWWHLDQARCIEEAKAAMIGVDDAELSSLAPLPVHPICATKVAAFLEHETTRPKKSTAERSESKASCLGASSIKQIVSALEHYRWQWQHEPAYQNVAESQKPLRDDIRIKTYEKSMKASELQQIERMTQMKAEGMAHDSFQSSEELSKASMSFLINPKGPGSSRLSTALRNRCMLLLPTTLATRGDNTRSILLSNLSLRDIPLYDVSATAKVPALVVFSNQGKENSSGRIDEHAGFRHSMVENCAVGSLAFHLFGLIHLTGFKPSFAPDFNDTSQIGAREWYNIHLFHGKDDPYGPMTYQNHRKQVNTMKKDNDLKHKKVTHDGRVYAVMQAGLMGASVESRMALGLWMEAEGGSFKSCYDCGLPVDAMLGVAGFNAQRQSSYFLACNFLEPPKELLQQIFPWVEEEQAALQQRIDEYGLSRAKDNTLTSFLSLLLFLRRVLLQDSAVLYSKHPELSIFQVAPFNTTQFREFSATASSVMAQAETKVQLQLQNLPQDMADIMRASLMKSAMHKEEMRRSNELLHAKMYEQMEVIRDFTAATVLRGAYGKKRKVLEAMLSVSPSISSDAPNTRCRFNESCSSSNSDIEVQVHAALPAVPTPLPSDVSAPVSSPAQLLPSSDPSDLCTQTQDICQRVISATGNIYNGEIFPMSDADAANLKSAQHVAIQKLEDMFSFEKLAKHHFEWVDGDWLPIFDSFWTPPDKSVASVKDFWIENWIGKNG